MLTIAFVTSALALLAAASPLQDNGIRIALQKRDDPLSAVTDVIDPAALLASLDRTNSYVSLDCIATFADTIVGNMPTVLPPTSDFTLKSYSVCLATGAFSGRLAISDLSTKMPVINEVIIIKSVLIKLIIGFGYG